MKERPIILASNSPRRKELLAKIIPEKRFMVLGSDISEKVMKGEDGKSYCLRIAEAKARTVIRKNSKKLANAIVIGADTAILFDGEIIGQPKDKEQAKKILEKLSGKKHEVITGVALVLTDENCTVKFVVKSQVWMKKLSKKKILEYIESNEPMDKAGAYGIQNLGRKLIKKYKGSYTNIIGLPIEELGAILSCIGGL